MYCIELGLFVLVCLYVCMLVCWCVGVLVCLCVGVVVCGLCELCLWVCWGWCEASIFIDICPRGLRYFTNRRTGA